MSTLATESTLKTADIHSGNGKIQTANEANTYSKAHYKQRYEALRIPGYGFFCNNAERIDGETPDCHKNK